LDALLFAHFLQEVGFIGEQKSLLEGFGHGGNLDGLLFDFGVDQVLQRRRLELRVGIQLHHPLVEVFECCHRALQILF
jgi:hypothetical protein